MLNVPSVVFLGIDVVKFAVNLGTAYMLFLAVSLTLNLEAGYTGVPNFGKVMFLAGGAAVSASVCGRLAVFILGINVHGDYNGYIVTVINQVNASLSQNPVLCVELILLGTLLAAGVGAIMGFLGAYAPLIGGTQGISVPNFFGWAGSGIGVRDVAVLGFLTVFAISVFVFVERVARSPLGRTLRAVRDNELASRALGKNDVAIRRNVIVIAGSGNNRGVALGALSFAFLFDMIDQVQFVFQPYLPDFVDVNFLRYILFAALLILILAFRPGGILPEKSSPTLPKRTLHGIMGRENAKGEMDQKEPA